MSQYKAFINNRLLKGTVKFYTSIKKNKLNTGIKKIKRSRKAEGCLKEGCLAFGTFIAKALTLEEAFQYPVNSVPLSTVMLYEDLCQSGKASLKYFLVINSYVTTNCIPEKASWFLDGLAACSH